MTRAIDAVLARFGGARALSRALGKANASTVQYWAKTGFLPRASREGVYLALLNAGTSPRKARRLVNDAVLGGEIDVEDGPARGRQQLMEVRTS